MYYDIADQTLKLARATSLTPMLPSDWTRQTVFGASDSNKNYVGHYVTMKFDTTGALHVATYRNSTGDLIYIQAPDADLADYAFSASIVVDSEGAVGAWTDISLNGTTPYISYLDSSMVGTFNGLKIARSTNGANTEWEYSTAALNTAIQDARTNIEYAQGAVTWTCAVGYKGTNFDIVYLKPEQ